MDVKPVPYIYTYIFSLVELEKILTCKYVYKFAEILFSKSNMVACSYE